MHTSFSKMMHTLINTMLLFNGCIYLAYPQWESTYKRNVATQESDREPDFVL